MRFVSLVNSTLGKVRRGITQGLSIGASHGEDDGKPDTNKLAEQLRQCVLRVNKLEALSGPEPVEFEVNVGDSGALTELAHGFRTTSIRWTVVGWFCQPGGKSPVLPAHLVYDPSSSTTSLFLRSYVKGRAIIRVEHAQQFVDPGPTLDVTQGIPLGRVYSGKLPFNDTALHALISVPIPDNSVCTFRVTAIGQDTTTLASRAIIVFYFHCRRQGGAGVIDLVSANVLVTATANYAVTVAVNGNNVDIIGQRLAVASPVTWTATVEPILAYLRDET